MYVIIKWLLILKIPNFNQKSFVIVEMYKKAITAQSCLGCSYFSKAVNFIQFKAHHTVFLN